MHKRYLNLQRHHIAEAFGLKMANRNDEQLRDEEKSSAAK